LRKPSILGGMKSVFKVRDLNEEERALLLQEFEPKKKELIFGRFFNSYAHNDSYSLSLRQPDTKEDEKDDIRSRTTGFGNRLSAVDSPVAHAFPHTLSFLQKEAKSLGGYLSRAVYVRTTDEYRPFPHVDIGYFYVFHKRYHIVLSSPGTEILSGTEKYVSKSGELVFLNNRRVHGAQNLTEESERVHLIFDVLPRNIFIIFGRYLVWLLRERRIQGVNNMTLFHGLKGVLLFPSLTTLLFTYRKEEKRRFAGDAQL
jgi:hypothetical protein